MTDAPQNDGGRQALQSNVLKFLEDQIEKLRVTAPEWVRAIVYFMFCAAFIVVLFRVTAGEYIVAGHIDVTSNDGSVQSVLGYEVAANHVYYGVNSNGDFFAVLSLRSFLPVLWSGKFKTQIIHNHVPQRRTFDYGRWAGDFQNLTVLADGTSVAEHRQVESDAPSSGFFALTPEAYAGSARVATDRLVVDSVRLWNLKAIAKVHLTANTGVKLQYGGGQAEVTLAGDHARQLGNDYCFVMSRQRGGWIDVVEDSDWFGNVNERFPLPTVLRPYNERIKITGSARGEMWVRWMSPYELILFRRSDIAARVPMIAAEIQNLGIRVALAEAPLGDSYKTNVLFLGSAVPLNISQSIIAILAKYQVPLSVVRRNVSFKSGSDFQLEVGAQRDLQSVPQLTLSQIKGMLGAKDMSEFAIAGAK